MKYLIIVLFLGFSYLACGHEFKNGDIIQITKDSQYYASNKNDNCHVNDSNPAFNRFILIECSSSRFIIKKRHIIIIETTKSCMLKKTLRISFYVLLFSLLYAFLARIVYNFNEYIFWKEGNRFQCDNGFYSVIFPISVPIRLFIILSSNLLKLPMKLADIVCNPDNYKYTIKLEKK